MWLTVLEAVGAIIGAVLTYLGIRHTGKQARAAAAVSRAEDQAVITSHDDVERRRDAVDGYAALSTSLLDRITSQDQRITDIEHRLAGTEQDLYLTQRSLRAALAYIERLLDFIAKLPGRTPGPPTMPDDVRDQMRGTP